MTSKKSDVFMTKYFRWDVLMLPTAKFSTIFLTNSAATFVLKRNTSTSWDFPMSTKISSWSNVSENHYI